MHNSTQSAAPKPRYVWPWFLAAAVVLGIVIAVFSIRAEANRLKLQRNLHPPATGQ
jgi:F0F1-type ATP synthase assembly protein I